MDPIVSVRPTYDEGTAVAWLTAKRTRRISYAVAGGLFGFAVAWMAFKKG